MGWHGVNPIIVLVNNGIFGVEEVLQPNTDPAKIKKYDELAPWQYHKLPEAMGCRDWFCPAVWRRNHPAHRVCPLSIPNPRS